MRRGNLATFAEEIAHELRVLLSAVSGEVDLALARDRSPAAYREALTRIAARVEDLIDVTSDLAVLGDASTFCESSTATASLSAVFAALSDRYGIRRGNRVILDAEGNHRRVAGDELHVTSALSLLVEHALRHCRDGSRVRLRALTHGDATTIAGTTDLVLDAPPGGFSPSTWRAVGAHTRQPAHGQLRVEAASRIIHAFAGALELTSVGEQECVRIRFRLV
jgi:signal transduction histidine kinase